MADRRIDFYHAPQSRSGGTWMLLEELGAELSPGGVKASSDIVQ